MKRISRPLLVIQDFKRQHIRRRLIFLYFILVLASIFLFVQYQWSFVLYCSIVFIISALYLNWIRTQFSYSLSAYFGHVSINFKGLKNDIDLTAISYIDQDIVELDGQLIYNQIRFLDEDYQELKALNCLGFHYDELQEFCQYIQNRNLESRQQLKDSEIRLFNSAIAMDNND